MMQSNAVNAMLLIPKTLDAAKTGVARGASSKDDTFMNMLNERIAFRKDNNSMGSSVEAKRNLRKSVALKHDIKPISETNSKPDTQKLDNGTKDIAETSKPEAKGKPEAGAIKNENAQKEEIEEEINSIEAMIALLEELMALLEMGNVSVDSLTTETSQELLLSSESREISPMELLMALVEGNAEKLETMMNELAGSQQTPEIKNLMEKIQDLIEKLTKDQNMRELKVDIVGESVSKKELIEQLRSQCGQLIDKLNEQVSKLNAALAKEQDTHLQTDSVLTDIAPEGTVLKEPVKAESKTQHETKDTKSDSTAFAKDADAPALKTLTENENPFENIFIHNQQIPKENLNQPVSSEKTQLPLSQKPLAQTVTNQVMMKVKLMAGENKQEMEMHLKPDSLGKLSLKIIHERGEILAKITAENQQVKGILESNMQMLKDALEKSGLTVQSLSVSVGNGNENGQNKENSGGKTRTQSASLGRTTSTSSQVDADRLHLRARIEKEYFDDTSQINLTA